MYRTRTGPSDLETRGWSDVLKPLGTTYNRYARTLEDWETGSLPVAYVGDRGDWTVQSNTADSGSFAAEANLGFAVGIISRDDQAISPGAKLTVAVRRPSSGGGAAGIVFGGTSATGAGSWSGYELAMNASGNVDINRRDDGSSVDLKTGSQGAAADAWIDLEAEWQRDGTITGRLIDSNGSQIGSDTTATDSTYAGDAWGFIGAVGDGFAGDLAVEPLADASLGLATL